MSNAKGRRWPIAEGDVLEADEAKPGDFQFQTLDRTPTDSPCAGEDRIGRLAYRCPRNGQPCGEIVIGKNHKPAMGCPRWHWDGNLDAPTLTPSINCLRCWHGWLKAGEFVSC